MSLANGIFGLSIALLLILLAAVYRKYGRLIQLGKRFPGPPALPIIGNAHHFIFRPTEVFFQYVFDSIAKYGDNKFIRVWIGPELNLVMSDLRDVEHVLSSASFIEKSIQYKFMRSWLNDGLLLSRGRKWFKRRKLMTPSFHFKMLEKFLLIYEEQSQVLVQKLHALAPGEIFDFQKLITLYTLDVIGETAMGVKLKAQTDSNSIYVQAIKIISEIVAARMTNIIYHYDLIFYCLPVARRQKRALAVIHNYADTIIKQRREELMKIQAKGASTDEDDIGLKRKSTFLDVLLQSEIDGKPLSNLDIREEVDTFMFGGHDTASSALLFFFYNMALNPECQRKCHEEIVAIFGKVNSPTAQSLTIENFNKLHYVELCIKETLRLFPAAPIIGRAVTQECEINGKLIPAGANIGILPLHIGRMAEYYPEPELFKPERFDVVTSTDKMNIYSFVPFSAGPRNCVGQKFAILEIKNVVSNVLRNFVIEFAGDPCRKITLSGDLILGSREPLMFRLKKMQL